MRPTFRNLTTSFEAWSCSSGLLKTINRLEHQEFLESQGKSLDRVIRLTEKGRQLMVGNRDPEVEWAREWDGYWRMVLFDIPETNRTLRHRLRSILQANHFGCLQQSAWLSPHPMDSINRLIRKQTPGLASLSLMECRQHPGGKCADVVKSAWDFSRINANYEAYIEHIKYYRINQIPADTDSFFAKEKHLWETAQKSDPLFPQQLIPRDTREKRLGDCARTSFPRSWAPFSTAILRSVQKQQQDISGDDRHR